MERRRSTIEDYRATESSGGGKGLTGQSLTDQCDMTGGVRPVRPSRSTRSEGLIGALGTVAKRRAPGWGGIRGRTTDGDELPLCM